MARTRSFATSNVVSSTSYGGDAWLQELATQPGLLRPGQVARIAWVSRNRLGELGLPWFELPGGRDTPAEKWRRRRLSPRALADKLWEWRAGQRPAA